jgi:putative serine/threonine protein kinase
MNKPLIIPIDQLMKSPYASILCFPSPTEDELHKRIEELHDLRVSAIEFSGAASLFSVKVPVVGKGFVGIVVVAHVNGTRAALKILRRDSGRADLLHEATMLAKANAVNVGPRLLAASKNFLLMQFIDGELFPNWLETNRNPKNVGPFLREILEQCWRLDEACLDHGELSKAPKHLLVEKAGRVFIVDFESASAERRVANVTAMCQYLFAGNSSVSQVLALTLGKVDNAKLVAALKTYKKNRNRRSFESLLTVCLV